MKAYHKGNVYEDLIQAAKKVLQEEGLAALSVRRVAREIGVVPSAVYNHFKGREDLLVAVAADGYHVMELLADKIESLNSDPEQRVRQLARDYLVFAAEYPNLYRLMFSPEVVAYRADPEFERASESSFGRLVQWWYGPGSYNPKKLVTNYPYAHAFWALLHGVAFQMIDGLIEVDLTKKSSIYRLADSVTGVLIDGVRKGLPKKA
jgi:AcrR family transcriptional regulator